MPATGATPTRPGQHDLMRGRRDRHRRCGRLPPPGHRQGRHHGTALTPAGKRVFDKRLPNSEPKMRAMLDKLTAKHGTARVVVDQPASIGALPPAVARDAGAVSPTCRLPAVPPRPAQAPGEADPGTAGRAPRRRERVPDLRGKKQLQRALFLAAFASLRASGTPLLFSAWPGAGSTSCSPCSATGPSTNPGLLGQVAEPPRTRLASAHSFSNSSAAISAAWGWSCQPSVGPSASTPYCRS